MIVPTVGRMVWVRNRPESKSGDQPESAQVVYVFTERMVNVAGFNADGQPFALSSLTLLQDGDAPPNHAYAEWMPYQKGQAAKSG